MEYVKIGGIKWDVVIKDITESFNILYSEKTGRTIAKGARMTLDPLGTFYGHKITFKAKEGKENEFDRLCDYLAKPRYDGIAVELVHNQTVLKYDAYVSQGSRKVRRIDLEKKKVYWDSFTANIIAMEAQVKPE